MGHVMPTVVFQKGLNGYTGTLDTMLRQAAPTTSYGDVTVLNSDSDDANGTGNANQVLLMFANLIGSGAGQIPIGSTITSATLTLQTTDTGNGAELHRMLTTRSGTDTWNSMTNGIQANGTDAVGTSDRTTGFVGTTGPTSFNVLTSVQAWASGAVNDGWVFIPSAGGDGWKFSSSEGSVAPKLSITYSSPTSTNIAPVVSAGSTLNYVENDPASVVAASLTVSDADSANLVGATVQISSGFASGQDSLLFTSQSGINGSWNPSSATLTLSGTATVAQYQAALDSVKYVNSSDHPSTTDRSIAFQVDDGAAGNRLSAVATSTVKVTAVNDPPVANADTVSVAPNTSTHINVLANDTDPDGDVLALMSVGTPLHGSASTNPDNTITYTPLAGYTGQDSFSYTIADPSGSTSQAIVTANIAAVVAPPTPIDQSYIATTLTTNSERDMQHDNAAKSFFHDGNWFAVLPDGNEWKVERFSALPAAGQKGGWTIASSPGALLDNNRNVDVAWDEVHDKLYVLQYYDGSSKPVLSRLGYDAATQTFTSEAKVQLAGSGGKLTGSYWGNNNELVLGLDENGNPLVAAIGSSSSPGLHLAYGSADLSTWSDALIDPRPVNSGGNSKVDFVSFTQDGVQKIGLAYSSGGPVDSVPSSGDAWMFASHDAGSTTSGYGTNWKTEVITSKVAVDNHISVGTDGNSIFVVMKDNHDAVWIDKGVPGAWDAPVLVTNGQTGSQQHDTSRPTLVVDDTNDRVFIFYQQNVVDPYGSIYMKSSSAAQLSFQSADLGTKVMQTYSNQDLIDPQGPAHAVTADMNGEFFMFAKDQDSP
ncbi:MAG: hypothetical protein JWM36_857, partial [Hyphomicrobiales bacterium]|nr:hypothetical protein [Hyphomicrobiales bacterium]